MSLASWWFNIFTAGGIFTARSKIYETDNANHGIHFVQEPQDSIITQCGSPALTFVGDAQTAHYGPNQGKAANTNIQAPAGKSLTIAQIAILASSSGTGTRGVKIMASDTLDTDDGTQLWSGTVNGTTTLLYAPYPLILPANKYLTAVMTAQGSSSDHSVLFDLTVIEEF